jgi:copper chaperone CopZ
MYQIRLFFTLITLALGISMVQAQDREEVIPVSGNCGMCKANIEKAAKKARVSFADWNKDTKMLTVKYDAKQTQSAAIQQAVAEAGYDTRDIRGNDDAYKKLHECCQYDRVRTYPATTDSTREKPGTRPASGGKRK